MLQCGFNLLCGAFPVLISPSRKMNIAIAPVLTAVAFVAIAMAIHYKMQADKALAVAQEQVRHAKEQVRHAKEQERHAKEQERHAKEQERHAKEQERHAKEQERHVKEEVQHAREEIRQVEASLTPEELAEWNAYKAAYMHVTQDADGHS
jgi:uncharacterized protein HemX